MAPRTSLNLQQEAHHEVEVIDLDEPEDTETLLPRQVARTGDEECVIPFRTSKRLQAVLYRKIEEREEALNNNVPAKDMPLSTKQKQHRRPAWRREAKAEILETSHDQEVNSTLKGILRCDRGKRKRKFREVTFADPLVTHIKDKEEESSIPVSGEQLSASELKSSKPLQADNSKLTYPPLSYFDLFCTHLGPRGWRCYRPSIEGKAFCIYHQKLEAEPLESRISLEIIDLT